MGLLDDAIREHLELKRRRGADPTEIEREESEALGPVRRDEIVADEPEAQAGGPYADDEPGLEDPGEAYAHEPAYAQEPPADEPAPEPVSRHEPPVVDEPPQTHEHPYAEPEHESATPPHGDPWVQQPTREFSSDELSEALTDPQRDDAPGPRPASASPDPDVVPADEEGAEDVLEETPEFLQETPEHDRLWFEQKPPKDFDF
jgi:hypothetical protein